MQILCAFALILFTSKGKAETSSSEPEKANTFGDWEFYLFSSVAKNNIWSEKWMPWTWACT